MDIGECNNINSTRWYLLGYSRLSVNVCRYFINLFCSQRSHSVYQLQSLQATLTKVVALVSKACSSLFVTHGANMLSILDGDGQGNDNM